MQDARLDEAQAGIKIAGRNINNLGYADDITLMEESEEELKSLLMKVKEESEKAGLKLNIQKAIMASSPITLWQIDGKTMETVTDYFPGLQNHCRWWLQSSSTVILEPPKIKSATVFPSICHEMMGLDAMTFVLWMLSFRPTFSLSSFTFIKRLFSFSLLSAIRVVSSAYLRLLIFLWAILIFQLVLPPAWHFAWCNLHTS